MTEISEVAQPGESTEEHKQRLKDKIENLGLKFEDFELIHFDLQTGMNTYTDDPVKKERKRQFYSLK